MMMIHITILVFCSLAFLSSSFASKKPCELEPGRSNADTIEIDEDTISNTLLYELPFKGSIGENGNELVVANVTMKSNELNSTELNQYFKLENFKLLKLNNSYDLDLVQIDLIELIFTCVSASNRAHRNTFQLYVTINDVNNKRPTFLNTPYKFNMKELTPVGTVVYPNQIRAIDLDLPNKPNSQISFSILRGDCSEYFEFPLSTRSNLVVKKLIDYDVVKGCNLTIQAEDHGMPRLASQTTVEISITDIDNKDPQFSHKYYTAKLKRNSQAGELIVTAPAPISAMDMDLGINVSLVYSLSGNHGDIFEIDPTSGSLKLKNQISNYDKSEYNLIVTAAQSDNSLKSAFAMISITVVDANEYPPTFTQKTYEVNVFDNETLGAIIGEVKAVDKDKNRIEYSLISSFNGLFKIDNKYSGQIKLNGQLDSKQQQGLAVYKLEVQAFDGNLTDTAFVIVNVKSPTERTRSMILPYFEKNFYNFRLDLKDDLANLFVGQVKAVDLVEEETAATAVGDVSAQEREQSSKINYSIKFEDQTDSKVFCITQIGVIYLCSISYYVITKQNNNNNTRSSNYEDDMAIRENKNMVTLNKNQSFESLFNKTDYRFQVVATLNRSNRSFTNQVGCRVRIVDADYKLSSNQSNANINWLLKGIESTSIGTSSSSFSSMRPSTSSYESMNNGKRNSAANPSQTAAAKNSSTALYVFIGAISSTILMLTFVAFILIIYKCRQAKNLISKLNRNNSTTNENNESNDESSNSNMSCDLRSHYFYFGSGAGSNGKNEKNSSPSKSSGSGNKQMMLQNGVNGGGLSLSSSIQMISQSSNSTNLNLNSNKHHVSTIEEEDLAICGRNLDDVNFLTNDFVDCSSSRSKKLKSSSMISTGQQQTLCVEKLKCSPPFKKSTTESKTNKDYLHWEEKLKENEVICYASNSYQKIDSFNLETSGNNHAQPTIIVSSIEGATTSSSSCSAGSSVGLGESAAESSISAASTTSTLQHRQNDFFDMRHEAATMATKSIKTTNLDEHFRHLNHQLELDYDYSNVIQQDNNNKEIIINTTTTIIRSGDDQQNPEVVETTFNKPRSTFKNLPNVSAAGTNQYHFDYSMPVPVVKRNENGKKEVNVHAFSHHHNNNKKTREFSNIKRVTKNSSSKLDLNQLDNHPVITSSSSSSSSSSMTNSPVSSGSSAKKLLKSFKPTASATTREQQQQHQQLIVNDECSRRRQQQQQKHLDTYRLLKPTDKEPNPSAGLFNLVFNNQEPLSVHSETNFVNDVVKPDRLSIYEDVGGVGVGAENNDDSVIVLCDTKNLSMKVNASMSTQPPPEPSHGKNNVYSIMVAPPIIDQTTNRIYQVSLETSNGDHHDLYGSSNKMHEKTNNNENAINNMNAATAAAASARLSKIILKHSLPPHEFRDYTTTTTTTAASAAVESNRKSIESFDLTNSMLQTNQPIDFDHDNHENEDRIVITKLNIININKNEIDHHHNHNHQENPEIDESSEKSSEKLFNITKTIKIHTPLPPPPPPITSSSNYGAMSNNESTVDVTTTPRSSQDSSESSNSSSSSSPISSSSVYHSDFKSESLSNYNHFTSTSDADTIAFKSPIQVDTDEVLPAMHVSTLTTRLVTTTAAVGNRNQQAKIRNPQYSNRKPIATTTTAASMTTAETRNNNKQSCSIEENGNEVKNSGIFWSAKLNLLRDSDGGEQTTAPSSANGGSTTMSGTNSSSSSAASTASSIRLDNIDESLFKMLQHQHQQSTRPQTSSTTMTNASNNERAIDVTTSSSSSSSSSLCYSGGNIINNNHSHHKQQPKSATNVQISRISLIKQKLGVIDLNN